ncbi:MAG: hypothetical protein RI897_1420 [Verrucomicrobiota bacterium]
MSGLGLKGWSYLGHWAPLREISTGWVFQIFSAYSVMERSEEKWPMRATLRMDMRVQFSGSW